METQQEISPIRFTYNVTPNTKILQAKSSILPAFHYTPQQKINTVMLQYSPLTCSCEAVFNPYCQINFNSKTVTCCICGLSTQLPANYAQHIQPNKLPYQFMKTNTTFQFRSGPKVNNYRYSYLFVIDINIDQKQLNAIKQELAQVVNQLPPNYNVGIITYSKHVYVYQLANKINTNYCINGSKEYSLVNVMDLLGVAIKNDPQSQSSEIIKRFIVPVQTYRKVIITRINNLRSDRSIYVDSRKHSCFGQALNVSIAMSQASTLSTRIQYLVGNPCTIGPGMTISPNFKQQMRSPQQLNRGQNIPYFVNAKKYYDSFIKRVVSRQVILDIFIFTCNQIGFTQMSDLIVTSGGFVVMHEQFRDRIFRQSFPKIFPTIQNNQDNSVLSVTEGVVLVYCSKQMSLNGALGQCHSLNKLKPYVSQKTVGKGGTYAWYLGSIDPFKTITFVYQTKQQQAKDKYYYVQVKTIFKNRQGETVTRITTTHRQWSNDNQKIIKGFDQDSAVVYIARQCVNKMLYEQQKNIRQWVDQILVKWAQNYANYAKNDIESFSLPQQMKKLPQMVYHLRRSHFVNRFGISLDESFFKGYCMNRQSVMNCLSMIQPILLAYSLSQSGDAPQPVAVPLDEQEMKDDVILVLDTYFVVIEWYGQTIKSWQQSKYHEMEQYQNIRDLFNSPKGDIQYIMKYRFPVPNFYHVHPYHSKQRYLKSRVNPKKQQGQQHENMLTDDSDLKGFTQHLMKVVVKQTN